MNILILNWRDIKNPKSGGAEIVSMEHAKNWVKNGHNVTWFTSEFKNSKREEKIEGISIVRRGNFITVILRAPFYYFFSKNTYDIVIDEIHGLPFFTPIYVRKPKIAFIHEVADEIWDYMFPFPINKLGKFLESFYFKFYKNVQFWIDADSTVDDLEKYGIKRANCTVINCPALNKPLKELPKKEYIPTFIFVSRVVKMKGIEDVIKTFSYVFKEISSANLWIVGDGDRQYLKSLKKMTKSLLLPKSVESKNTTNERSGVRGSLLISSSVKFFGKVSDLEKLKLMRKAHLLLHASVKEGWGLVVIEAASQGTPSVVYNVAGLKDSVKNNKTGIVLKHNDPKEMAREVISLMEDKKKYLSFQKNGLSWAKSLTWDKATVKSLRLLTEVRNEIA